MESTDVDSRTVARLRERLTSEFGPLDERVLLVRCPGRTEIAGNHTDHEGGHVIAGAIDRYVTGLFRSNGTKTINLLSEGYDLVSVSLDVLEPVAEEHGTTKALVRGMAALLARKGLVPAGFDCVLTSDVPVGSGLSSSAAFEVELARGMDALWADGDLPREDLALMAQADEREFFGKPCGLMDQASVALGGIQHMSFADPAALVASPIDFDFAASGYAIVLVAVGAGHENLIDEYAAIPREMQDVARLFGRARLCEVSEDDVTRDVSRVREECGDRALLRALHFFREERLVEERAARLGEGDVEGFLRLERLSGASSAMYLQNVSTWGREQDAMVALGLADEILLERGAVRIHGGGFGGTIQAFVPLGMVDGFVSGMDAAFGRGASGVYNIDHEGVSALWL